MSNSLESELRLELEKARNRVHELENKLGIGASPADIQALLKSTVEQMHEGIQIIDREYKYIYLNDASAKQVQTTTQKLLGRTMMECYPGIETTEMFSVLKNVMEKKSTHQMENLFEFAEGKKCWFEIHIEPHAVGVLIRSIDITSRKKIEEQYRHSQKMESIGHLAGSVAHDFNNKLGIMMLYCEMIQSEIDPHSVLGKYVDKVLTAVESSSALTKQLLAFSRKQILNLRVTSLNDVITQAKEGLGKLLGENIKLKISTDSDLDNVRVDTSQIDQIILNLCVNARDAMPDGGVVTIETANVEIDAAYCATHPDVIPGDYVMLSVSDTGTGMSPEIKDKVFEPFFTTKGVGKGTGLGLSSVHGIAKQARGHIWLYSEQGIGTTLKLYFPKVKEAKQPILEEKGKTVELIGTETILLVEDDRLLLTAFELALKNVGYKVFASSNAAEAKNHFMQQKGEVDLLLTDIILPNSTGHALSRELAALNPKLKMIYISGYTENTVVHHGVLETDTVLIQKPLSTKKLLSTIRQVLDGSLVKGVI